MCERQGDVMSETILHTPAELLLEEVRGGAVWLIGAGDGVPARLSQSVRRALVTADVVIADASLPPSLMEWLRREARYLETVAAASDGQRQGARRATCLAAEGWRVVRLVAGAVDEPVVAHGLAAKLPRGTASLAGKAG